MFDAQAAAFLDAHELDPLEVTDGDLNVSVVDEQGVTSVDRAATAARVTFSRKLHYLLANLTTDAVRLVVRQNYDSNGFETWRRLVKKFALPDATRHVSLLTQLLDFRFNPQTFEQDFNTWETIKVKYEKQTGTALPDSVLVATLFNKTSGALQTHLRLNARTLTTYEESGRRYLGIISRGIYLQELPPHRIKVQLLWTLVDLNVRKASAKVVVSATSKERKEKEKERKDNLARAKERVPT